MVCHQQDNNRNCALFSIANATELAFKGGPDTERGVSRTPGAFRCLKHSNKLGAL